MEQLLEPGCILCSDCEVELIDIELNSLKFGDEIVDYTDLFQDLLNVKITSGLICNECQSRVIQFYNFKKIVQPNLEFQENSQRNEIIKKLDMFLDDHDFDEEFVVLRYQQCFTVVPSTRRSLMQNFQSWQPRVQLRNIEQELDKTDSPETKFESLEIEEPRIPRRRGPKNAVFTAEQNEYEEMIVEETQEYDQSFDQGYTITEINREEEVPNETLQDEQIEIASTIKEMKSKQTKEQREWANETTKASYSVESTDAGDTPIWTCILCSKVYVSAAALRLHLLAKHLPEDDHKESLTSVAKNWLKTETRDRRALIETIDGSKFEFTCGICQFSCTSNKTFRIHLIETHIKMIKPVVSGFSEKKLSYHQQSWIQSQIKLDSDVASWKCQKCLASFQTEKSLRQHLHEEHVLKFTDDEMKSICISTPRPRKSKAMKFQWTCQGCWFQFSSKRNFDSHMKLHETLKSVSALTVLQWCNECNMFFRSCEDLDLHTDGHSDDLSVLVTAEGIALQKTILYKRLTIPEEAGSLTCGHCGRKLLDESECKSHLLIHHVNPLICPKDGREFKSMQPYVCHLQKVHSDLLPASLVCPHCKEPFDDVYQRLQHMKLCNEKKFTCDLCDQKFASKPRLHNHLKREMGLMSCDCSVCGKTSKTKDELKIHMRSHTKEKPYKCSICEKRYTTTSARASHMETHKDTAIQCEVCSVQFIARRHYVLHFKRYHDEGYRQRRLNDQTCEVCSKQFIRRDRLREHMDKVHNLSFPK